MRIAESRGTWADDVGAPDERVRQAMAAAGDDSTSYLRAVAELCLSRLLLPIAADPDADLSAVMVRAPDGSTGLLAFTGIDSFQQWNPKARPLPCTLDDVAATAIETGSVAVVIDIEGPCRLVIAADVIAELAKGRRLVELPGSGFGWMSLREAGQAEMPAPGGAC